MDAFGILWKAVFGRPFEIDEEGHQVSSFVDSVRLLLVEDVDSQASLYLKDFFLLVNTKLMDSDFGRFVPPVPGLATLFCLLHKEKGKFDLLDDLLEKLEGELAGVSVICLGHFVGKSRKTFSQKTFPEVLLRMASDEPLLRKTDSFLTQYDFENQKVWLSECSSVQDKTKRKRKEEEEDEEDQERKKTKAKKI